MLVGIVAFRCHVGEMNQAGGLSSGQGGAILDIIQNIWNEAILPDYTLSFSIGVQYELARVWVNSITFIQITLLLTHLLLQLVLGFS